MRTSETVGVSGAADLLQVHPKTVLDLINAGDIPAAKVGRAYVMMTRDVLDYIQGQIINQTADRLAARGRTTHSASPSLSRRSTRAH